MNQYKDPFYLDLFSCDFFTDCTMGFMTIKAYHLGKDIFTFSKHLNKANLSTWRVSTKLRLIHLEHQNLTVTLSQNYPNQT